MLTRWHREDEALQILADLHGGGDPNNALVQLEFEEIKQQVYFERTEGSKSYLDLLKPGIFRRVGLGASLQMWSQLSGVNTMMCIYLAFFIFVDTDYVLVGTISSTCSKALV